MHQTLRLTGDVYRKLAQGAAERGMTVEALLAIVSDLIVLPEQPTDVDRVRSERIDTLLDQFRAGKLNPDDRRTLDELIDADFRRATARADRLIRTKRTRNGKHMRK